MVKIAEKTGRLYGDEVDLKVLVTYELPKDSHFEQALDLFVESWNNFKADHPNELPDMLMLNFNTIVVQD